jgi:hypothetical protein
VVNLDDIHSNHVKRCALCGIPINVDNDSGWEIFVEDGKTTQPICAWCDVEQSQSSGQKIDMSPDEG